MYLFSIADLQQVNTFDYWVTVLRHYLKQLIYKSKQFYDVSIIIFSNLCTKYILSEPLGVLHWLYKKQKPKIFFIIQ